MLKLIVDIAWFQKIKMKPAHLLPGEHQNLKLNKKF